MAEKTIGDLNGKVNIDASGVISGLMPAINAWKAYNAAAQGGMRPGSTVVNATAMANVERERTMLAQITGVSPAGAYDTSRLQAFTAATHHATTAQKQLWAAQIQTKVAANMVAYSMGSGSNGAAGAVRNLGNTAADSQKGFKHMQLGIQNAGYQVQDFFVQIAGGQSKITALTQQLPQLLGSFGMAGAIAGTAVAVGGLVAKMVMLKNETEQTKIEFTTLRDTAIALRDVERERQTITGGDRQRLVFAIEDETEAEKKLNEQMAKREILQASLNKAISMTPTSEADMLSQSIVVSGLEAEIKRKTLEIENLRVASGKKVNEQQSISYSLTNEEYQRRSKMIDLERERITLYKEQLESNADFFRSDKERLGVILDQMDALAMMGEVGTLAFAKLEGASDKLRKAILEEEVSNIFHDIYGNLPPSLTSIQEKMRIPQGFQMNQSAMSTGGMVGNAGANSLFEINRRMYTMLEQIARNTAQMAN